MSDHFSVDELTFSSTAQRLGIDNTPSDAILLNLQILRAGLEKVRSVLGNVPMKIDSGYRCEALNEAIGGAPASAHLQGLAADFLAPEFGVPVDVVAAIVHNKEAIRFHRVIQEGTWTHIDFPPAGQAPAYLVLTAHFGPGGTTYSTGA